MTQPKKPLRRGDRVKVYAGRKVFTGEIEANCMKSDCLYVIEDGFNSCHEDSPFHPKQLRRLKPRAPRRRLWTVIDKNNTVFDYESESEAQEEAQYLDTSYPHDAPHMPVEFIEVRRGKSK